MKYELTNRQKYIFDCLFGVYTELTKEVDCDKLTLTDDEKSFFEAIHEHGYKFGIKIPFLAMKNYRDYLIESQNWHNPEIYRALVKVLSLEFPTRRRVQLTHNFSTYYYTETGIYFDVAAVIRKDMLSNKAPCKFPVGGGSASDWIHEIMMSLKDDFDVIRNYVNEHPLLSCPILLDNSQ